MAKSRRTAPQSFREGDGEVIEESQDIAFELVQPDQEIVSWSMRRPSARPDLSGERRLLSM
ncbi:MAG TPA: hypothetical protein VJY34_02570, partial [Roseiarcus sp.]|nr:hypothetical protein [Roseiarcus sp.]